MEADEVEESPKPGTLKWVQTHDLIAWGEHGEHMLPTCHRVPADASLAPADASTRCRVVYASGERCQGTRTHAYGLCMGHLSGGGASDLSAMSRKGAAKLKELRMTRELLGIGPRTASSPRAAMRLRAAQRAADFVRAVVDEPLDDPKLSSAERQRAALAALDASWPMQSASLSVTADPEGMDWTAMQEFATSLLG